MGPCILLGAEMKHAEKLKGSDAALDLLEGFGFRGLGFRASGFKV